MKKPGSGKNPVRLSHETLQKIFQAFHIRLEGGLILFALRGCVPGRAMAGWGKSVPLLPKPIDYVHMRCTLGIWDPARRRIFAAIGSTVPHRANVERAADRNGRLKGKGTNQLEPGFYTDLTKGEHLQGKRNGHQALRQTANRFYRRSLTGVPYTRSSPLFYGNPYDNLHCGWNLTGIEPGYSSAGCMVVAGIPHCHRHESPTADAGPWKIFHDILYATDQHTFPLLLLPYAAAASSLHGSLPSKGGKNLVYGSSGEEVKALQAALSKRGSYLGKATGILDARTYRAWMKSPAT